MIKTYQSRSSFIDEVSYDSDTHECTVTIRGKKYNYVVPMNDFKAWEADSFSSQMYHSTIKYYVV